MLLCGAGSSAASSACLLGCRLGIRAETCCCSGSRSRRRLESRPDLPETLQAATLASSTQEVNANGPPAASLRRWETGQLPKAARRGYWRRASAVAACASIQRLSERFPVAVRSPRPRSTFGARGGHHTDLRGRSPQGQTSAFDYGAPQKKRPAPQGWARMHTRPKTGATRRPARAGREG